MNSKRFAQPLSLWRTANLAIDIRLTLRPSNASPPQFVGSPTANGGVASGNATVAPRTKPRVTQRR